MATRFTSQGPNARAAGSCPIPPYNSPNPAFDAAAWFAAWSDHGGIAMLLGDRLWIGRAPVLDRDATRSLNGLRRPIMHPDAQNALAGLLRANAALSEQMMEG